MTYKQSNPLTLRLPRELLALVETRREDNPRNAFLVWLIAQALDPDDTLGLFEKEEG